MAVAQLACLLLMVVVGGDGEAERRSFCFTDIFVSILVFSWTIMVAWLLMVVEQQWLGFCCSLAVQLELSGSGFGPCVNGGWVMSCCGGGLGGRLVVPLVELLAASVWMAVISSCVVGVVWLRFEVVVIVTLVVAQVVV